MSSFSTTGLLLFCALLGSAFTITCKFCNSATSDTCAEETEIICPGQCMTASQFFHNGPLTVKSIYKGCAMEKLCGLFGSVTEESDVKVRVRSTCCSGDNCNNGGFSLPEENTTLNGLSCPSSYCTGTTKDCASEKEQQCTGSETKCVNYIGKVKNPDNTVGDYSVKGCINPLGCTYNFKILLNTVELLRKLLVC